MNKNYKNKLVELAKEIRQMQLGETQTLSEIDSLKKVGVDWKTLQLNLKINYLIRYIMALEEEHNVVTKISKMEEEIK